ncbi:MAG TPA: hypothetical protein VG275_07395 [Solirubrobacteraceae bacterium]|nr:hypothetical protein [Solirubrobacteraceae bacterium]
MTRRLIYSMGASLDGYIAVAVGRAESRTFGDRVSCLRYRRA